MTKSDSQLAVELINEFLKRNSSNAGGMSYDEATKIIADAHKEEREAAARLIGFTDHANGCIHHDGLGGCNCEYFVAFDAYNKAIEE